MALLRTMRAIAEFSIGPVGCYKQLAGLLTFRFTTSKNGSSVCLLSKHVNGIVHL
jgi:hypothetical protein